MSIVDRLAELARAAGSNRAALFRSRAGMLGGDEPVAFGQDPSAATELLAEMAQVSPVRPGTVEELAAELRHVLADPRRRSGPRGNLVRVTLGHHDPAELVLVRGDPPAALDLGPLLSALETELGAWAPPPELRPACGFVALDDRTLALCDERGSLLAMSPAMRRALGADPHGGTFVPRRSALLSAIRELAAAGQGERLAEGTSTAGTLRAQRIGAATLVELRGLADLEARLTSLAVSELTPREIACGLELSEGKSYKEIAGRLTLSPDTVKLHLRALYQKLGVGGREGFVAVLAGIAAPSRRARA